MQFEYVYHNLMHECTVHNVFIVFLVNVFTGYNDYTVV